MICHDRVDAVSARWGRSRRTDWVSLVGFIGSFVVAVALAGCTSPRDLLGSSSSPCFRALPVAARALRGAGHYAGVRYLSPKALAEMVDAEGSQVERRAFGATRTAVCAVAYQGSFITSRITGAVSEHASGSFALVIVAAQPDTVIGVIIERTPSLRFRRVFPLLR